jgi:aminoglycoside 3-N-acetyltransferase
MVSFRDLVSDLGRLEIPSSSPVLIHTALSSFKPIRGGAETLVGALASFFPGVMAPTFTYQTMLIPEIGPEENGIEYGRGADTNRMAVYYHSDLPADRIMGVVPETLRKHPSAVRSSHPILSFAGIGLDAILESQTLQEPLAPIKDLAEYDGWVLLMGVDHTVNTSLHYAEKLAGRRSFVRWALTLTGVLECPGFPGCSQGFNRLASALRPLARIGQVGGAITAAGLFRKNPRRYFCSQIDCLRCNAVRRDLEG